MNTAAVGSEPSVEIASGSRQLTRRGWRGGGFALALTLFGGSSALAQNCTDLSSPLINNLGGTASAAAGAASALAGSLGNVSTAFVSQQTSAFVAGATSDRPDQQSGGVWARGVVGTVDTKSSTSALITETAANLPGGVTSVSGTCASKVSQDYWGVQAGTDVARLNMNGWNVHLGITAGYFESRGQDVAATARSTLENPVIASLQDGFQVPFIGGYVVATQGSFFSDLTVRREIYNVSFTQPGLNLYNQHFGARAWSISGGAGYNLALQDGWFVEPSAGLIWSRTSVDPFGLVGPTFVPSNGDPQFQLPGLVSINDINSLLGRATVRVGKNFTTDGVAWQPFASASVFHEFAGDVTTNFVSCAGCVFFNNGTTTAPATIIGSFSTSRVGTYGQLSAGLASQIINTGWVSFIRGDYRFGSNIEGWNATAGVRYNFVPEALPARGKMVVKAPVLAALYDWSGFYIGGHAGVTQGRGHIGFIDAATTVDPYISGYLWGGQVGYNLQYGPYLVGWEAEGSRTKTSGTKLCSTSPGRDPVTGEPTGFSPLFLTCANSLDWIATAAIKLGFVPWWSDRTLLYVKGGGAATSLAANIACIFGPANNASSGNSCRGVTGLPTNDSFGSTTRFGGLLAAGVEFGLTRNVSAKAEIAYIKFANGDITTNDGTRLNIGAGIAEGKIGLNYRFNQPIAASY